MRLIDKTTIKFIIVGVINTLIGTGVMFIMYNIFNFGYWYSSVANYVVGSIVSYVLNKYITFNSKSKSIKEVIYFIINISVCYLLAYGLAKPFTHWCLNFATKTIQDNVAMLIGMCLFIVLNYIGQRYFVFNKKD